MNEILPKMLAEYGDDLLDGHGRVLARAPLAERQVPVW